MQSVGRVDGDAWGLLGLSTEVPPPLVNAVFSRRSGGRDGAPARPPPTLGLSSIPKKFAEPPLVSSGHAALARRRSGGSFGVVPGVVGRAGVWSMSRCARCHNFTPRRAVTRRQRIHRTPEGVLLCRRSRRSCASQVRRTECAP
jgi:hypothetical protein